MNFLMIGATGKYESLLISALKKRKVPIIALMQDNENTTLAIKNGADKTAIGDFNNLESLNNAMTNVDGLFYINPAFASDEAAMGVAMVTAAKKCQCKKVCFFQCLSSFRFFDKPFRKKSC